MLPDEWLMESVETRTIMTHLEMVQLSFVLAYSSVDRRSKHGNKYLLVQKSFPSLPFSKTINTSFHSELKWRNSSSREHVLEISSTLGLIWTILSTGLLFRIYSYTTVVANTDISTLISLDASPVWSAVRLRVTITRLEDEDHTKLKWATNWIFNCIKGINIIKTITAYVLS